VSLLTTQWNTKEIKDFKGAFQKRAEPSIFGEVFKQPPVPVYQKALAMLIKRQADATQTLQRITAAKGGAIPDLLRDLGSNKDVLDLQTAGATGVLLSGTETPAQIDILTGTLVDLTDRWVAFEGRCIAMSAPGVAAIDDAALRAKMMAQASDLVVLATTMRAEASLSAAPAAPGILQRVTGLRRGVEQMIGAANGDPAQIADLTRFGADLDIARKALQDEAEQLATIVPPGKKLAGSKTLQDETLERLYGIKLDPSDSKFPYRQFMAALALVPSNQATNAFLSSVQYKDIGFVGADYSKVDKRIRIDPRVRVDMTSPYRNPETGAVEQVNSFSISTLHEVGHSVDHAYGLMAAHGSDAACGGWVEVSPLTYMGTSFPDFVRALTGYGARPVRAESCGDDRMERQFIKFMVGHSTAQVFLDELKRIWLAELKEPEDDKTQRMSAAYTELRGQVTSFFEAPQNGDAVALRLAALKTICAGPLATLTAGELKIMDIAAFDTGFARCFPPEYPENPAAVVERDELDAELRRGAMQFTLALDARVDTLRQAVDGFANFARSVLPPTVDLKPYLAGATPWNKDLSDALIGGKPASHEPSTGSSKWVRYAKAARQARVTDYQFRAPSEWFAELYAITWFKQVEPPGSVGQAVRPYLYGGHVT
jgi:hypothetical protein